MTLITIPNTDVPMVEWLWHKTEDLLTWIRIQGVLQKEKSSFSQT